MVRFNSSILFAAFAAVTSTQQCQAFTPSHATRSSTALSMSNEDDSSFINRRQAFAGISAAFLATATAVAAPQAASAKYSDYARREKDWESRMSKGELKVSTPRDLRAQLREIAPMNTGSSQIFCPNGPSANVSPMMENKCGDRLATPSVYGRSTDSMGNSIPGFKEGAWSPGGSSSVSASTGGFPAYKENEWKVRDSLK
jgi:hypothetical protein